MFGVFKKREPQAVQTTEVQTEAEIMGLREYIGIDSMKAHLVDILEENRRLKEDNERIRRSSDENSQKRRKEYELAVIEADEWKKREGEAQKKAAELNRTIDELNDKVEKLEKERNSMITKVEMAKADLQKAQEIRQSSRECKGWLEKSLKSCGNWEKVTKSELINILKTALAEEEKMAAAEPTPQAGNRK